jgi:hypothetical protein
LAKSGREKRTALLSVVVAPLVKVMLHRRGYAGTTALLEKWARRPASDAGQAVREGLLAQSVMSRLPGHLTCLDRSVTVWWLVGGSDIADLYFGVAKEEPDATPTFHAWVEVEGARIEDAAEGNTAYLPLAPPQPPQPDSFD